MAGPVEMTFDKAKVAYNVEPFRYVVNPTIKHVVNERGIVR